MTVWISFGTSLFQKILFCWIDRKYALDHNDTVTNFWKSIAHIIANRKIFATILMSKLHRYEVRENETKRDSHEGGAAQERPTKAYNGITHT